MKNRIFLILFVLFFTSCENFGLYEFLFNEDDVEERFCGIQKLSCPEGIVGKSKYSGVLITDVHFGAGERRSDEEFLNWFSRKFDTTDESLKPRFAVCLGDSVDGGHRSEYYDFNDLVAKMQKIANDKNNDATFKVYTTIGNHDLYNNGWEDWKDLIFPKISSYYFQTSKFSFYFLDTANGSLGNNQLEAMEDAMSIDGRPKVIFTHYPIFENEDIIMHIQNTMERARIITAFAKGNVKEIFVGHVHSRFSFDFGKFKEDVIPSYLFKREACFFTIDENSGTVNFSIESF